MRIQEPKPSRYKYNEIEVKEDCIAYLPNKDTGELGCDCLIETYCKKELCAFYKPKQS